MANTRTFVGLDAHSALTQAASLDVETGEISSRRIPGDPLECISHLESLPRPLIATYEAGPCGYRLARAATSPGIEIRVCAPSSIPRRPEPIKNDRRDSERLARLLAAGELRFVRVPSVEEERCRDLSRCRDATRGDLMRARHRLSRFLSRHELDYPGKAGAWTAEHRRWLGRLAPEHPALRAVLADYLAGVEGLMQRRITLDREIGELAPASPWAEQIARLRCLRGIDTVAAFGICAEVGEFTRFQHPSKFAAYLGLVPSLHSSAESTRRGPITKAGSSYARRLVVESAHHYWRAPRISRELERRQRGQDPRAVEIGWRCQQRLHQRWSRLRLERRRPGAVVITAMARELSSFIWEVGQLR